MPRPGWSHPGTRPQPVSGMEDGANYHIICMFYSLFLKTQLHNNEKNTKSTYGILILPFALALWRDHAIFFLLFDSMLQQATEHVLYKEKQYPVCNCLCITVYYGETFRGEIQSLRTAVAASRISLSATLARAFFIWWIYNSNTVVTTNDGNPRLSPYGCVRHNRLIFIDKHTAVT